MKDLMNLLMSSGKDYLGSKNNKSGGGAFKGAAVGSLATLLLGNKKARKFGKNLGKNALTIGGTAAVGGAAYYAYQKWKNGQENQAPSRGNQLGEDNKAMLLLQAMVFAAKSDGHVDNIEMANIENALEAMELDNKGKTAIQQWLTAPLDANAIANQVNDLELASEVYMASLLVIEVDHFKERVYLDQLATALRLPAELKFKLEQEIDATA